MFRVSLLGHRAEERGVDRDVGRGDGGGGQSSFSSVMNNPQGKIASLPGVEWLSPCGSALTLAQSPQEVLSGDRKAALRAG